MNSEINKLKNTPKVTVHFFTILSIGRYLKVKPTLSNISCRLVARYTLHERLRSNDIIRDLCVLVDEKI